MSSFKRIFQFLWPETKQFKISFFLIFFSYGIAVVLDNIIKPYIYKDIVDLMTSGEDRGLILMKISYFAGAFLIIVLIHNIFYRIGDYAQAYFESKMMKRLYDTTFDKLLQHSYTFFANSFSGSIVAKSKRFTRSFETLQDILGYQIWFSIVNIVGIVIVLFFTIPILAFIFLGWSFVYILVTFLFIKKKVVLDTEKAAADSLVNANLADVITNILNVKIFSGSIREQKNFRKVTQDEEKKRKRSWYFGNLQNVVQSFFMALLQVAILFLCIHLWYIGSISLGTFILVESYMVGLMGILWNLGLSFTRAAEALSDMREVLDIIDLKPDIIDISQPEKPLIHLGEIHFNNISFEYVEGQKVFKDFNLVIKPGEKIGLVGHSGSGKTTITKILLRFSEVKKGEVLIDTQNITKIKQDDLRSKISYVPQDPILFHRTIRENIAYSNPSATEDEIVEAAKRAHAHEFIIKLPNGYDAKVGERGIKLSGGERQRIAIARAMLKDSPILMLDEATSSLDSISEYYIQDAFNELMKGKTTIVIAHRLSTIQKMDRIIVLDKGVIVEEGTHKQLLKKKGVYASLWDHQTGGFLEE